MTQPTRPQIAAEKSLGGYTQRHARKLYIGELGNNSGTVDDTARTTSGQDFVFVRLNQDANQVVSALAAASFPHIADVIVVLELVERKGAPYYQVLGIAPNIVYSTADTTWSGVPGEHASQHERRDRGAGGFDPLDVYTRALVNLRARAQITPDLTVHVERGFYIFTSVKEYVGGNSAAFVPPAAVSSQRWDLLYLGSDDALHIVSGAVVSGFGTPVYPACPTNAIPIAYVLLRTAQTSILETDITDARVLWTANQPGGGVAPDSAQYLTLALNGSLTSERVLTAGNGITLTDGGANGNATLSQTAASAGIDTDANVFSVHHSLGGGGNQASPGDHVHPAGNGNLTLASDGGWCWFGDPRAVYYNNQTYFGYIDKSGNIKIRSFNHISQTLSAEFTLHAALEVDDHDNPSILIRASDKRIIVFYSKHVGNVIYERISTNPEDISSFQVETTMDPGSGASGYTYPNPVQLTGETNSPIYLFFRRHNLDGSHPWIAYTKSTDGGVTWGAQVLVAGPDVTYAKVAQNGVDRIDLAVSNHPNEALDHSVYHFYYQGGNYYKSNGTLIASALPLALSDLTKVYDGVATYGWIWDIAIDVEGNPAIAYTTYPGGTADHRYNYAKWVNGAWATNQIVAEGNGSMAVSGAGFEYYSGGVVLDHQDPTIAYLSKYVSSKFEIWKYQTPDNGTTWTGTAITSGSSDKNVRPVAVRNHASDLKFLWLEGTYTSYTNYDLSVKGYGSGVTSFAPSGNTPQDVASANAVGSGTNPPHDDHVHKGVHSLAKQGDTALYGDVTLTGTGGITLTRSSQNIAIDGSGISGGGSHLHGLARWIADGAASAFDLPDIAEYVDSVTDAGVDVDALNYSLSADGTQVTFASVPTAANILQCNYVIMGA